MNPATIVQFEDVLDKPKAKMDLPSPLRVGDRLQLRLRIARQKGGRNEILDVVGEFRIKVVSFDSTRQILSVESMDAAPVWKAVKKTGGVRRKLSPARHAPQVIE
jgi:hypothetical protein